MLFNILVALFLGTTVPTTATAEPIVLPVVIVAEPEKPVLTIEERIRLEAKKNNVDADSMIRVMNCESSGNPNAINHGDAEITGKPSYGLFQFQPGTFYGWAKIIGETGDIMDVDAQIRVAAWAFSEGLQYHWSCWNK
jgi:hypothetical protein